MILDAARVCFSQQGYHRTTMRAVARQAGLAEGTLYNHFRNKDDLLLGLFGALGEQTRASMVPEDMAALDLRPFLEAFLAAPLAALAQDGHALFRIVVSEALVRPALGRALAAAFAETGALGAQLLAARPELRGVDTAPMIHTGLSLVLGLTLQHALEHGTPPDTGAVASAVTDLLLATLPGGAA
ncbi:TetR/AcrR family transcriptional regulator [Deinococcus metalli]|uniref:TetR/AcrR family transcriptional regulator n=1 Tax=Deinococcus metalli TaxID=1141878 RepID=UPI0036194982